MITPYVFVDNDGNKIRVVEDSELEAITAVGFHVAKTHTCMIARESTHPDPIGSGTIIQMGSQLFVATAKHLLEEFTVDDLIGIYWGEKDNRAVAAMESIIVDDNLDLAAIPLPPDTEARGGPLLEYELDKEAVESELFVLTGVPTVKCDIDLESRVLQVGHFSLGCMRLPPHLWPTNPVKPIRPDVDLLLNYTRDYAMDRLGDPMCQIAPFGMSGGGIWSVPKNTDGIWSPDNARLVAIQSTVESDQWRYLRCTRIEPWIQLLSNC